MDKLTDKHIHMLSKAFKTAKPVVKNQGVWQFINAEYGIGNIDKNNLQLNSKDYHLIRELIISETGLDISEPLPTGSRIEIAKSTGDEKFNADAPGRHHIMLNSHTGQLEINNQIIPLMCGASYRTNWKQLQSVPTLILVVENLQAFDYIQQVNIPEPIAAATVVYRGHNISSKAVIDFLKATTAATQVIAFCDFDPKGIEIALTLPNVSHILLPDLKTAFEMTTGTRSLFDNQHAAVTHINSKTTLPESLKAHWAALMQQKRCVTQENMIAHNKSLVIVAV